MTKRVLVVHPTGNQNSRAVARGLANANVLKAFITAMNLRSRWFRWLPGKVYSELARRDFGDIEGAVISGAFFREAIRLVGSRFGFSYLIKHEVGYACIDNIYIATDKFAAAYVKRHANELSAVYCYEDCALETFRAAKALGICCIYELPIGYWREHRRLNKQEITLLPEWRSTWISDCDSDLKLARKDSELALADRIVVASQYTKKTLSNYPGSLAAIQVIPYGCPAPVPAARNPAVIDSGKLKVLYVGGLSQRKGLSYLIDALQLLSDKIDFAYIGSGNALSLIERKLPSANYLGTMPHSDVLASMRQYDVLVFPSLFEGFGMVITEAMSQGMVVIATDHTALPDIANASSSICIPIRDSHAIKEALEFLIADPDKLKQLSVAALEQAQRYQWKDYERRIVKSVTAV